MISQMKAILAVDADLNKVRYPIIQMPKIDGMRAHNFYGEHLGRSGKPLGNEFTRALFSQPELIGLDGEMAANSETHPDLCRLTTSAMSTYRGEPFALWWVFDFITFETRNLPYHQRLDNLSSAVNDLQKLAANPTTPLHTVTAISRLRIVPYRIARSKEEVEANDSDYLDQGYEGSILRDPQGVYKFGRTTAREANYLRIKRFMDAEAVVIEIIEGEMNNNEAQVNELGQTFRSSHKANMVPNGMVGALLCRSLEDSGVIKTGDVIKVSAGKMTHDERRLYFNNPELILNKPITYKHMPHGAKDKPRMPTFKNIRAQSDMG